MLGCFSLSDLGIKRMKRSTILNRDLSYLVASLGHLDEIVVSDASFPVPSNAAIIDLALMPGVPSVFDALHALSSELMIEKMITCAEKPEAFEKLFEAERAHWQTEQGKEISADILNYDAFKVRSEKAKAIIRTGTLKPHSSIILISGLPI